MSKRRSFPAAVHAFTIGIEVEDLDSYVRNQGLWRYEELFGNLKTAETGSARSVQRAIIELRNRRSPNRELA
jgi:hypothetical protein